jgi:serine protein kinase
VSRIYEETDSSSIDYEGRLGVSPREMRTVLLDAAQSAELPLPVTARGAARDRRALSNRTSEYDWLREKPLSGGYHDHALAREVCQRQLHERLEDDFRSASGLIDEERTSQLFDRYVTHVSVWVKGEKVRNAHTGVSEPPDERAHARGRDAARREGQER